MGRNKVQGRVGETILNNQGCEMEIVKYSGSQDIIVRFNGYNLADIDASYNQFKKGEIKNPYFPSVVGKGYIGIGKYKINNKNKREHSYSLWTHMLERCYSESFQKRQPTYSKCKMCDEWHNFQNFAEWYDLNFYKVDGKMMQLDKDIITKGNKLYSPDTCMIVPRNINVLFTKNDHSRNKTPIGVSLVIKTGKYIARCKNQIINKRECLGTFNTPTQAFEAYKEYKEKHIKEVADHYRDKIPQKLYDAMYRYEVEITD